MVFNVNPDTVSRSSLTPVRVINNSNKINLLSGIYLEDTWQITEKLRVNAGVRWDRLSGYTYNNQIDPTINFVYLLRPDTTLHAGSRAICRCRAFRESRRARPPRLQAPPGFAGTGTVNPETEDDYEWDVGIVHQLTENITVSEDDFY